MHETQLIATIARGFVLAFAFGYVASRLRLPPLVGYLVAGFVAGPFTPAFRQIGPWQGSSPRSVLSC